jgi:hypothetical protein
MSLTLSGDSPKISADSTGVITSGTAVASTSGTSIDFTGIPSWVKRITLMLNGVSTNGSSFAIVQLGSTTFTTSGYVSSGGNRAAEGYATNGLMAIYTNTSIGTYTWSGHIVLTNITGNTWVSSFAISNGTYVPSWGGGVGTASGVLDRIRITTVNGTDTFDAGSINILYE